MTEQTKSQKAEVLQKFLLGIALEKRKIERCKSTKEALKNLLDVPGIHEPNSSMSTIHEDIIFEAISELDVQIQKGFKNLGGMIGELFALSGFSEQLFAALVDKHDGKLQQLCETVYMGTKLVQGILEGDAKAPAKVVDLFAD